jgi:hypothetical protein
VHFDTPYSIGPLPEFGLSDREMDKFNQSIETDGMERPRSGPNGSESAWGLVKTTMPRSSADVSDVPLPEVNQGMFIKTWLRQFV